MKVVHFHFLNENLIAEGRHPPALIGLEQKEGFSFFVSDSSTNYFVSKDGLEWYRVNNSKKVKEDFISQKLRSEYLKYLLLFLASRLKK